MMLTISRRLAFTLLLFACLPLPLVVAEEWSKAFYVDLVFVPQENLSSYEPDALEVMFETPLQVTVVDARNEQDRTRIGDGGTDSDERFEIRAKNEVGPFVERAARESLAGWGLLLDREAGLRLEGRLLDFRVEEKNKAVGSTYLSKVAAAFTLRNADGETLWQGSARGEAKRFGRKQHPTNMNEVLSDALKIALGEMLKNPELRAAWPAS